MKKTKKFKACLELTLVSYGPATCQKRLDGIYTKIFMVVSWRYQSSCKLLCNEPLPRISDVIHRRCLSLAGLLVMSPDSMNQLEDYFYGSLRHKGILVDGITEDFLARRY